MDKEKKIAAALAAVHVYRQEQAAEDKVSVVEGKAGFANLWGLASRQELMAQKGLWHYRPRR